MPVVICQLDSGGLGGMLGRLFAGENSMQNHCTAKGGPGMIAFASSFPGCIRAYEITPSSPIICQKKAFLASTSGVEMRVHFQKKLGGGFFGGEGFVMQKISGSGTVFLEIDGSTVEYELVAGQQLIVDTGYVAMMDATEKWTCRR